jgi:hypothetical protein
VRGPCCLDWKRAHERIELSPPRFDLGELGHECRVVAPERENALRSDLAGARELSTNRR